jgi:ABC-type molybdate transport system ATPase subunit
LGQGVAFRIAVAAALLEQPSLLLIDASLHNQNLATLRWLNELVSSVPRLVATAALPYGMDPGITTVDISAIRRGAVA